MSLKSSGVMCIMGNLITRSTRAGGPPKLALKGGDWNEEWGTLTRTAGENVSWDGGREEGNGDTRQTEFSQNWG